MSKFLAVLALCLSLVAFGADPILESANAATVSPANSSIPPLTYLIDSTNAKWTVKYGVVYRNGVKAGYTEQVTLLTYTKGLIYQENAAGGWWYWYVGNWVATTDPRPRTIFWGLNGHYNEGGQYQSTPMTTQLMQLQNAGVKLWRHDLWDATGASNIAWLADQAKTVGVQVEPVLTGCPTCQVDESAAYSAGYALGQTAATVLRGKVGYYEVGNELENAVIIGGDGNQPTDYDNTNFKKARGGIRGMIAGVKSVDTTAKIVMSPAGWLHFGFLDMLWNGTQPDGSSGYPQVRWDVTAWHWYSDMGDITNACGASGCHNVLAYLHTHYNGAPIFIDEYGVRPGVSTEDQIAAYLTGTMLPAWTANASTYGVKAVLYYDHYDDANLGSDGNYGLWQSDGVTPKGRYAGFKAYLAAHPL
jgi:hypothetical protein